MHRPIDLNNELCARRRNQLGTAPAGFKVRDAAGNVSFYSRFERGMHKTHLHLHSSFPPPPLSFSPPPPNNLISRAQNAEAACGKARRNAFPRRFGTAIGVAWGAPDGFFYRTTGRSATWSAFPRPNCLPGHFRTSPMPRISKR